jgi:stearoyl-CoA desaturase (delta-9 desaturase)
MQPLPQNFFAASAKFVTLIQLISLACLIGGAFIATWDPTAILVSFIFYFLYSGVGVSMMLHRYWTHKSFEFKSTIIKWLCTWFALQAGRGSIIGWVHIHREHHAYADTEKDPHAPNINGWRVFFPHILEYGKEIKRYLVRDLFNATHLNINKYYKLIIFVWAALLFLVSPWLFYFAWAVPIALTHIALNSFTYFGHSVGYSNHTHRDESKNFWVFAILLWGEGWHNNHHKNPGKWNLQENWWEVDLISYVIRAIKK